MRYRAVNTLGDISRDVAAVVDFIGVDAYRGSLEAIGRSLNAKGFVTPFDDAAFRLELDLLNLEVLRARSWGLVQSWPPQCHRGLNFLIGLGQTLTALSGGAKTRLLGRVTKGLKEGLWPLEQELRIAANLSKRGWSIYFHDLEEGGGYDFLAVRNGVKFEVEAKAISAFTGWPIKPENLNKLLVEIKHGFSWADETVIPVIGLKLSSALSPNRTRLQELIAGLSEVAKTRRDASVPGAQIRFMGVVPSLRSDQLARASYRHAQMAGKTVLVNPTRPKLVLELDSEKKVQLERKIIRTVNEAATDQFSRANPAVIWTHINFISEQAFTLLSSSRNGRAGLFDRIASATLISQKRVHLGQLVFSGGSFLQKSGSTACSSYASAVYDSPACSFGNSTMFPGGRKLPLPERLVG